MPHAQRYLILDDHLRNSLSTQSLAANKVLALQSSQSIEESGNEKQDGGRNQTRCTGDKTDPLDGAHDGIHGRAHPVSGESPNEVVEFLRSWANPEQEGNLNENEDQPRNAEGVSATKASGAGAE